ncbi:FAD-dependent monooxygenase [Spirosoma sp. BT702]|uniref:FAD-dependent monooxygenase n=1 Tax=Spirosoma profusum TaxID=2771354 RepID=A0A926XYJ6_9BACT|nr:NAD(P)/FAD-dependent oxidoreductase [Spirosoma profusum]MBD2703238.1 FAD-dependent monooxygenase [Spirosoma profusum]
MTHQKALIIGCGISGPVLALFLKKIGFEAIIYEAKSAHRDDAGAFLGISPNGLNVLKEFMPLDDILTEFTPGKMTFYNAKNKSIGEIDNANQQELYGAETVQLKRGLLNQKIRQVAIENGIQIEFGKKLTYITQTDKAATVFFDDGTSVSADFIIGCDGIHSATRNAIFPNAPALAYTGLLSTGGFTKLENVNDLYGSIRMTFGERAFFAYAVSNTGDVWWFNNISQEKEPERNELSGLELAQLKSKLLALHQNDPAPIADIIKSAHKIEIYPVYDIPFLKKWHKGRVCLLGDAAHATAPHIGQGASLALEDAIVLAKCLRDLPDLSTAFTTFQSLRQERVQKIVREARKVGDTKTAPNKFQQFFRDLLLPFFVKFEAKKMDWVYSYKTSWGERIDAI